MERTRRLRELWNWLPVFRVVAETQHLPTAADALFVSPASLSRTISLLEDNIGIPLFDRVGRGLRLNSAGAALLDSVRDGMRAIDEGVSTVNGKLWSGQINVWAEQVYAYHFLMPLADGLQARHPALQITIQSNDPQNVTLRILRGQIDLALVEQPPVHRQLQVDVIAAIPYALYCSRKHTLATQEKVSLHEISKTSSFAVPVSRDSHLEWPPESPRNSVLFVEDLAMARQACHQLNKLAALPVIIADDQLHPLPTDALPPATLYAVYRKPVGSHPRTEALLDLLTNETTPPISPGQT